MLRLWAEGKGKGLRTDLQSIAFIVFTVFLPPSSHFPHLFSSHRVAEEQLLLPWASFPFD